MKPNFDTYVDIPTATEDFLKAAYHDLLEKRKSYNNANHQLKQNKESKANLLAESLFSKNKLETDQMTVDSYLRDKIRILESDLSSIDFKIKQNSDFILDYYKNIKECNQVGKNIKVLTDFTIKIETISNARNTLIKALEIDANNTFTKSSHSEQISSQIIAFIAAVLLFSLGNLLLLLPFIIGVTPLGVICWPLTILLFFAAIEAREISARTPCPIIDYTVKAKSGADHVVSDELSIYLERFNPSLDAEQDDALSSNTFVDTKTPVVTQAYLIYNYGHFASNDASTSDHDAQVAQPSAPLMDISYFYP